LYGFGCAFLALGEGATSTGVFNWSRRWDSNL
jgi:hypothetical protein